MHTNETKVSAALERLNHILPLFAQQQALDVTTRHLHRTLLRAFVELGRPPTKAEIAQQVANSEQALTALKDSELVLFDAQGEVSGAYPFTVETREHRLEVNGWTVHCMCALDALAVSPMFALPSEIRSQCRLTGQPVHLQQQGQAISNADEARDVFFAIDWNAAAEQTCCADSLCTEMIFVKGEDLARQWQVQSTQRQIFSLPEAMDFAAHFFCPLLED